MRRVAAVVLTGLLAVTVAPLAEVTPTWATFTDGADLTGTTFSTYTVPAPVFSSCVVTGSGNSRTVTFNWTGVTSPATTYTGSVATLTTTSAVIGGTAAAPTYAVALSTTTGSGNRGKTGNVSVSGKLTASPTWTGPAAVGTISVNGSGTVTCAT